LQALGDQLDRETGGRWVAEAVLGHTKFFRPDGVVVVDAVRQQSQITELRKLVTPHVIHIHVTACEPVLIKRYRRKQEARKDQELPSFTEMRANPTEAGIDALARSADLTINTQRWRTWPTFALAYVRIRRVTLKYRRRALARSGTAGALYAAAVALVLLGAPLLVVSQLRPATGLVIVYAAFLIVMSLLIGWALSSQSPAAGLPRRRMGGANRDDAEAQQ